MDVGGLAVARSRRGCMSKEGGIARDHGGWHFVIGRYKCVCCTEIQFACVFQVWAFSLRRDPLVEEHIFTTCHRLGRVVMK